MFACQQKRDWRNSPAHLLLLSKFRNGDSPERYNDADCWEAALTEPPIQVIERFVKEAVLELADLQRLIEYKFNSSRLKSMVKERGLKTSGSKEELARRLVESDVQAMRDATKDLVLYRCTAEGLHLSEHYLNEERAKREAAEQGVLALLAMQQFSEAVRVVAQYEAAQVFPRGLGIDWKEYKVESDAESLRAIYGKAPGILMGMGDQLRDLRPAAAMMLLWGESTARQWLRDGFETGIRLDAETAARMLVSRGIHVRKLQQGRSAGVKRVEVLVTTGYACFECQAINGKKYRLESAPELPYPKCTSGLGCRCTFLFGD